MKSNLKNIRFKRGINQDILVKELKVSRQTISSLKNRRYHQ